MTRDTIGKVILSLLAIFVLAGGTCSDAYDAYVLENYAFVKEEHIEIDGQPFAILDIPEKRRMLVAHRINHFTDDTEDQWDKAARAYLQRTGRDCTAYPARIVTIRQIEFRYSCRPAATVSATR